MNLTVKHSEITTIAEHFKIQGFEISETKDQKIMIYVKNMQKTRFGIGSMSKMFGAYIIKQLVDAGIVQYSDCIDRWLDLDTGLTIKDVLTHNVNSNPHLLTQMIDFGFGLDVMIGIVKKHEFKGRKSFNYNNIFYVLLGKIIEIVTGKQVETVLQELVEPLGMKDTGIGFKDSETKIGYWIDDSHKVRVSKKLTNIKGFGLAGGIVSTAQDMIKWLQFIMEDTEFLKLNIDESWYGNGMWTSDAETLTRVHVGSVRGFSSAFVMIPRYRYAVCVLTNMTESPFPRTVTDRYITQYMLGLGDTGFMDFNTLAPLRGVLPIKTNINLDGTWVTELFGEFTIDAWELLINGVTARLIPIYNTDNGSKIKFKVQWLSEDQSYYDKDRVYYGPTDQLLELEFRDMYPRNIIGRRKCD